MKSTSSRWRFAAAVSPIAIATAATPAWAQDNQAAITGAASAATAAQDAQQGASPAPQADQGDTIVVTGFRASLQSAVNKKKQSDQIVGSVSAEEYRQAARRLIGGSVARLPDIPAQRLSAARTSFRSAVFGPIIL